LWFLLGLLFIATGLYLGFEFSMSFLYMMIGFFCCVFGIALFLLRLFERPTTQAAGGPRKPIEFAAAEPGPAETIQAISGNNPVPVTEQPET
jgi:peptidoglycan/LPS O-acetylase OafA/YrhL